MPAAADLLQSIQKMTVTQLLGDIDRPARKSIKLFVAALTQLCKRFDQVQQQQQQSSPSPMAESGSEDGEIAGEVNENYDQAGYVQHVAAAAAPPGVGSNSRKLALLQQLVPGWGEPDELEPAAATTNGHVKRKPKKEKKRSKKQKQGSQKQPVAAAAGDRTWQQQAADYRAFYGAKVSLRWHTMHLCLLGSIMLLHGSACQVALTAVPHWCCCCCASLQAHPDIQIKTHDHVKLQNVQDLVLWVLGDGSASKFAMVQVCSVGAAVLQANRGLSSSS